MIATISSLRSDIANAYATYCELTRIDVENYHGIGTKVFKGYQVVDNWYTPSGRKRKVAKKEMQRVYHEVTEQEFNDMLAAKCKINSFPMKLVIGDWTTDIYIDDFNNASIEVIEYIISRIPLIYREGLKGLCVKTYNFTGKYQMFSHIEPVFDDKIQNLWNTDLEEFYARKSAWCEKYGCE